jgi:hypothetical protein
MAVVAPHARSRQRTAAVGPAEVLRIPGTPAQVAAVLARMINDGWVFEALPVTRGRGQWLVSACRPVAQEQQQMHA